MTAISHGGRYCKYLRKSRADELREAMGEGETLAKHDKALDDLAARLGVTTSRTYREIVSGESIQDRPEMQKLLSAVRAGEWDGVLTMEVERLSRGDSTDQGIVGKAFLFSRTLIITPGKIYDPLSEDDMEYFEFGLFMSRREFKKVNKRLVNGRIGSVKEGQYIGKNAPYGYRKVVTDGMKTLTPDEETAPVLREIFDLYESGESMRAIARRLTILGVPAPGGQREWIGTSLSKVLRNDVYIGNVSWMRYVGKSSLCEDNVTVKKRRVPNKKEDVLVRRGLHEPLVAAEQFERVQRMLAGNKAPLKDGYELKNPYSRILVCSKCGHALRYDHHRSAPYLRHINTEGCRTRSTTLAKVNDAVATALVDTVEDFQVELRDPSASQRAAKYESDRARLLASIAEARKALSDNFDRMERGIITEADFIERRAVLDARADAAKDALASLVTPCTENLESKVSSLHELIKALRDARVSPQTKNQMLRANVKRIEYANGEPGCLDQMRIDIFLD